MRRHGALVLACTLVLLIAPAIARSAGTISGTVTDLSDPPKPIPGAVVTVAGPGQPPPAPAQPPPPPYTTDSDGRYSIPVSGSGPYGVGVQAKGFASQSVGGVTGSASVPFALAPAKFTPLSVYAGTTQLVVADATSGIFYALMAGAPEVYRTLDYGGSWQPVIMSYDDSDTGLRSGLGDNVMAASSVPGEIAVDSVQGEVFLGTRFSTDYGLTWRTVPTDSGGGLPLVGPGTPPPLFFWAHAGPGAPSVLLAARRRGDGGWDVWRADMSALAPAFVKEGTDPFGRGSVIAFADSLTGSFVGRLTDSGALSFAPLAAPPAPIAFGDPAEVPGGLPAPPLALALGGAKAASAPPAGALVAGGTSPSEARLLIKGDGAASFTGGSARTPLADCLSGPASPPRASVAPTTGATSGAGHVGGCWLRTSEADPSGPLDVSGFAGGGGFAYDARWGQANHVGFIWGRTGPIKSGRLDPATGAPFLPPPGQRPPAQPGPGEDSGGWSVNGISSPDVRDLAYGPAGSSDLAIAGQNLSVASKGGGPVVEILPGETGSFAVQWWQGSPGNRWLVFGHLGCTLTALHNWDGASTVASPNAGGSTCADLGGPNAVGALEPVRGTDTLFIGLGPRGPSGGESHVYRARLAPTDPPSLTEHRRLDPDPPSFAVYPPTAMAYCPDAPSTHEAMRDVLFVGTGGSGPTPMPAGALFRIANATGDPPAMSRVDSFPHDVPNSSLADVRADCATGVVYAAAQFGLYKSVDGGQSFAATTVAVPPTSVTIGYISAIGLNLAAFCPTEPPIPACNVDVAVNPGGIAHSADGGATWALVSDPATSRPTPVHDIEFAPSPPAGGSVVAARAAAAPGRLALVGGSSGAYLIDTSVTSGLIGLSRLSPRQWAGAQITELAADAQPALAEDSVGRHFAVFRRSNGLAYTEQDKGGWSLPVGVPGTQARDSQPALARDASGRLHLAFRRSAGPAPGIYYMTLGTDGAWSAPQRVSGRSADTLPALALTRAAKPPFHIAFLRSGRRSAGIWHATNRRGRWRLERVPRTGRADARPAFGGPALAADSKGRIQLAFARASGRRGIYYALRGARRWRAPRRVTKVAGDRQPALAVAQSGTAQVVFRRTATKRKGLFSLRPARKLRLARVPGTLAADTQPALTFSGGMLKLVFARRTGPKAGIYYDETTPRGRWLAAPERRSLSSADANPALTADASGRVAILFERG